MPPESLLQGPSVRDLKRGGGGVSLRTMGGAIGQDDKLHQPLLLPVVGPESPDNK